MASAESYERGVFTLTWEIENFGLLLEAEEINGILRSPLWKVEHKEENARYQWLVMNHKDQCILFHLLLLHGGLRKDRIELYIISSCGEVPLKKLFNYLPSFFIEKDALFDDKKQSMLPNNALTLRLRIWGGTMKNQELRIRSILCSVEYLWNIQHFYSSRSYTTVIEQDNFLLCVFLKTKSKEGTHMVIAEVPNEERCVSFVDCTLSTTNDCELIKNKACEFPYVKWTCDIEKFPENKERVDVKFRSIVSLHKVHQDKLKLQSPIRIVKDENAFEAVSGPPSALADNFLLLYREGTLSDATLNTEGKSFLAHRSILAARSPVFRAMFEKEMSEGRSGVVDIDDVDSATVNRMLVFLYGEKLDDVQWEEASALYCAADKYDVLSLKQRCVDILKAGLTAGNACEALILADMHSDEQLKKYVVDFIRDHQEVFSSSKWEKLEESNSRLTTKILREVYVKKRKVVSDQESEIQNLTHK